MENIVEKAKRYAIKCHEETNHLYDGKPYSFHLQMGVDECMLFIHLIPEKDRPDVIGGMWCHDTVEDCRQTRNDVEKATNVKVANITYALSNEKGRNRKERANSKYYKGIREEEYADYDKLCDRRANVKYAISKGLNSRMFMVYKESNFEFIIELTKPDNLFLKLLYLPYRLIFGRKAYRDLLIRKHKYAEMILDLDKMFE